VHIQRELRLLWGIGGNMRDPKEKIVTALKHLGVKGEVRISQYGFHLYRVEVNGKYFGIYDIDRDTFVD